MDPTCPLHGALLFRVLFHITLPLPLALIAYCGDKCGQRRACACTKDVGLGLWLRFVAMVTPCLSASCLKSVGTLCIHVEQTDELTSSSGLCSVWLEHRPFNRPIRACSLSIAHVGCVCVCRENESTAQRARAAPPGRNGGPPRRRGDERDSRSLRRWLSRR